MDVISIGKDYTSEMGGRYAATLADVGIVQPNSLLVINSEDRQFVANVIGVANIAGSTIAYIGNNVGVIEQLTMGIGRLVTANAPGRDVITAAENYNYGPVTVTQTNTRQSKTAVPETPTTE